MKNLNTNAVKFKDFKRIVLPVDGSDSSKRAVEKALSLAKETGVEIIALYVMEYPYLAIPEFNYTYPNVIEWVKKEGNAVLEDVKNKGLKIGIHVKTKLVEGTPDDQIIKEAKKNDLIIMGCKGKTALSRILLGSVCEKVLHHSESNVMVIR